MKVPDSTNFGKTSGWNHQILKKVVLSWCTIISIQHTDERENSWLHQLLLYSHSSILKNPKTN